MGKENYVVLAQWDDDEKVWYVKASDIPGLVVETATLEQFREVVCDVAPDLLADVEDADASGDIPIWVKAEALTNAPRRTVKSS